MKINEIFGPTVQGEGKSVGRAVMFLRLALCNLRCVWCDTKYTWDWEHHDRTKEVHEMGVSEVFAQLEASGMKSVVVSGGEPLLQQKELVILFRMLKASGWWIEVETNGTMSPTPEIFELVDQFNCSPKLSNSGDSRKIRVRHVSLSNLSQSSKVWFKFVIASEQDLEEVQEYVNTYGLTQVFLMPLGKTREELDQTRTMTQELCARFGFQFSDRLHVIEFGGIRGV